MTIKTATRLEQARMLDDHPLGLSNKSAAELLIVGHGVIGKAMGVLVVDRDAIDRNMATAKWTDDDHVHLAMRDGLAERSLGELTSVMGAVLEKIIEADRDDASEHITVGIDASPDHRKRVIRAAAFAAEQAHLDELVHFVEYEEPVGGTLHLLPSAALSDPHPEAPSPAGQPIALLTAA
jgi:hypothetical protein